MWLRIMVTIFLLIIVAPILLLIPVSFNGTTAFNFPPEGFSLRWYSALVENPQWFEAFQRSLIVATLTSLIAVILGVMAAIAVNQIDFPGKKIFANLIVAPMAIPTIIIAIALYFSFTSYDLTNTIAGLVLGHSIIAIPFVFITVLASIQGVNKNIRLAAESLGSTPIGVFFKITLPIIRSSIMAGFIFAFVLSLDEVVLSIFLTGPVTKTLPILMWENFNLDLDPTLAAVSTLLIAAVVLTFVLFPKLIQISAKQK
jgi:putative spermidine/putrescine transport system permease protein